MCGIVGYIGKRKAWPILVEGLKRLEYRGYDSAGAALMSDTHQLNVYKSVGKVADLERTAEGQDVSGCVGIAHTRWATHGEPSTVNAHPHCSQNGDLALVHNGIIENYAVLKEKLQAKGCTFKSSTDTEVLVQLIGYIQQQGNLDLLTAVQLALREVIGAYAIAVVDRKHPDDVVIAISQSGETADTLAAIELAKSQGAFIYGICNVIGSSIARATDTGSYIHVGPEIGVASTKAFTGQVTVLTLLALALGREKGTLSEEEYHRVVKELVAVPEKMRTVLKQHSFIADFSKMFTYARNFIYLGRGYAFPVALEGALKLKEISYIHAEGYPAAEMKHGPIALIDAEMPVVIVATQSPLYEKVLSNIQEIKARKGRVVAVVTEGDTVIRSLADYSIELPATLECLDPLVASIPLQLLAYYIAVCRGMDVDQPRNLAKSVTVE